MNNCNFTYFYRRLRLTKNAALFIAKNLSICLLFMLPFVSKGQTPGHVWAKTLSSSPIDGGHSIAIDGAGNVYSTGRFGGTMDFDPGPGLFQLVADGGLDIYISKLGADGQFVWAKRIGGPVVDIGMSICLDQQGNVYVTGQYNGTVDFDPGPNTYNMTSINNSSFVVKLNQQGDFVWARHLAGGGSGAGVATDSEGNVYVTGGFGSITDFDPGAGVFNMNVADGKSFVTKLDKDGVFVWAKQMAGSAGSPSDIKTDDIGNIYTTGTFTGTADLDPGPGVLSFTSRGGTDIYISKLNTNGELIWAIQQGGAGVDMSLAIDVDMVGNVYTAGRFMGTANFDPGSGVLNLNSNGAYDAFISKLDSSGQLKWVRQLGGTGLDRANSVSVDDKENVYVIGTFIDSIAVGSRMLISNGGSDIFICQLDATGGFVWAHSIGGQSNDSGNDIVCDYSGNVYVTGEFQSPVMDFDPGIGVNEITGSVDPFVLKLGLCSTNTQLYFRDCDSLVYNGHTYSQEGIYDNTFKNVLDCDSFVILNVTLGAGFDTTYIVTACDSFQHLDKVYYHSGFYTDSFTKTNDLFGCDSIVHLDLTIGNTKTPLSIATCDSFVLGNTVYTISGNYTAVFRNQQGCDSTVLLDLEIKGVSPEANVSVKGETLIAGSAASYQWLDCNDNYAVIPGAVDQTYTPEQSGTYAALITNDQGCSDTSACVEVEIATSINEAFRNNNINLYPNPAIDHVVLTSKNGLRNAEIQIVDMYGRILFKDTYTYENQVSIDLSGFAQGIYMFKVVEGTCNTSFKVIKK